MVYRTVPLFVCCLQLTWACVPVKPSEDMPCPSLPQAAGANGYLVSGLKGPTIQNGARVYTCTAPDKLLSIQGAVVTELADGATIKCIPNSGLFTTDDGLAVGSKTFTCGEKLVACPAVPEHTTGGIAGAQTDAIPPPTMSNGDTIYQCKAPKGKLFKVPNGDPTMAMHLGTAATIKCKRQSGKIFLVDGTETEIDPAGMDKYTCGEFSCQLCEQTKLVDPTAAATQTDFLCKSKPTVTITANCPMLSCPTGESLYLLQSATTGLPVAEAQVKCDTTTKMWLFDGTNPVDAAAPGFVCATTCKQQCDTPVTDAYSNMNAGIADILMNPISMQPTCIYKCPTAFSLTVSGQAHDSVVCNMNTKVLTADTPTGTAISAANQFSCATCACPTVDLNDGSKGLCPMGFLCITPTPGTACEAICPTDSMAIYNDAAGALKTSPTLMCAGTNWITAGKAAPDVACMFLPGKGFVTHPMTPPGTTVCTALTELTCPSTSCQFAELIYVKNNDGYAVTCKTGSLVTDVFGTQLVSPCVGGAWTEGIAQATCVQDDTQVDACLGQLDPAVKAVASFSCELGTCYISCTDPTKQFEYMVDNGAGPVVERNKLMKCHEMNPAPINLQFTDGALIKCI